jgi:hypothetical protein
MERDWCGVDREAEEKLRPLQKDLSARVIQLSKTLKLLDPQQYEFLELSHAENGLIFPRDNNNNKRKGNLLVSKHDSTNTQPVATMLIPYYSPYELVETVRDYILAAARSAFYQFVHRNFVQEKDFTDPTYASSLGQVLDDISGLFGLMIQMADEKKVFDDTMPRDNMVDVCLKIVKDFPEMKERIEHPERFTDKLRMKIDFLFGNNVPRGDWFFAPYMETFPHFAFRATHHGSYVGEGERPHFDFYYVKTTYGPVSDPYAGMNMRSILGSSYSFRYVQRRIALEIIEKSKRIVDWDAETYESRCVDDKILNLDQIAEMVK